MSIQTAADVTEDLENRRSASLNFLFLLSPLLLVFLANHINSGNIIFGKQDQQNNVLEMQKRKLKRTNQLVNKLYFSNMQVI